MCWCSSILLCHLKTCHRLFNSLSDPIPTRKTLYKSFYDVSLRTFLKLSDEKVLLSLRYIPLRTYISGGSFQSVVSIWILTLSLYTIFPTLGSKGPQWCPVEIICPSIHPSIHLYVCLSISMYSCLCHFLAIICVVRNCAQRMQLEATGSNIPSGSIICPFFCPFGYTLDFFDFCIFIHFLCWV